jgi:hypothetical protein
LFAGGAAAAAVGQAACRNRALVSNIHEEGGEKIYIFGNEFAKRKRRTPRYVG